MGVEGGATGSSFGGKLTSLPLASFNSSHPCCPNDSLGHSDRVTSLLKTCHGFPTLEGASASSLMQCIYPWFSVIELHMIIKILPVHGLQECLGLPCSSSTPCGLAQLLAHRRHSGRKAGEDAKGGRCVPSVHPLLQLVLGHIEAQHSSFKFLPQDQGDSPCNTFC